MLIRLNDVYLRRYTPDRSSGHSILVGQLVLCYLDFPTSPAFPGYQADQVGPGCLSVLHQAGLRMEEKSVFKMCEYTKPVNNKHSVKKGPSSVTHGEKG